MNKYSLIISSLVILIGLTPSVVFADIQYPSCREQANILISNYIQGSNNEIAVEGINQYTALSKACDSSEIEYVKTSLSVANNQETSGLNQLVENFSKAQDRYYKVLEAELKCQNQSGSWFTWASNWFDQNCYQETTGDYSVTSGTAAQIALAQAQQEALAAENAMTSLANHIFQNHKQDLSPEQQEEADQFIDVTSQRGKDNAAAIATAEGKGDSFNEEDTSCSVFSAKGLGYCVASIIDWVFAIINAIIGVVLKFVGILFNYAIEFSVVNFRETASSPGIMEIWKMIRDLTNIGFIFMLLYAGFMTLFQDLSGKMNPREIVAKVLLFALLVNFSAPLTRTAIDLSNVPALLFYNQMSTDNAGGNPNISNFIIQNSNVAGSSDWSYTASQNPYNTGSNNVSEVMIKAISKGLLTMLVFIGLIYVLATAAFNFLLRSFILLFLIMTSPVYFIAKVVPGSAVEGWAKRWSKNLKCWCLYAPIYMGGLYLVMALMAQKTQGGIILKGSDVSSGIFLEIVWFGLILTLLFSIDKLAKDLGCEMASAGGKFETKLRGYGSAILSKGKALPGRTANATLGRGYVWGASKLTGKIADRSAKWASSDDNFKRFVGRQLTPTLNKIPKSGFGTGENNEKRTESRQTRHGLVMANMSAEQKAKYIQGMYLEGAGIDAYNSLSKKDKIDVQLAAQKLLKAGDSLDKTNIGKAKAKLKGEAKKDLEKQVEEQMRQEMIKEAGTRKLVDEKGKPILDENGEKKTEKIVYEAERNVRMAEFLMNQSATDRKIIYESIKNDKDRALLENYLEQSNENQKKLIDKLEEFKQKNPTATPEQIEAEKNSILEKYLNEYSEKVYKETGKQATDAAKEEERARMERDFDREKNTENLKKIKDDFADLKRELPADRRDGIEKEVKKIKRDQSKKEIDDLLKEAVTAADVTSDMIKKLIKDFKGNLNDLGDLLTSEKFIKELSYQNFADLRGKNKGLSDNVLNEVNRMIKKNGLGEATAADISKALGVNEELVDLARSGPGSAARGKGRESKEEKSSQPGHSKPTKEGGGGQQPKTEKPPKETSTASPQASTETGTPQTPNAEPASVSIPNPSPETPPEVTPPSNYRERPEPTVEIRSNNPKPVDPNIARLGAQELRDQQGRDLRGEDINL